MDADKVREVINIYRKKFEELGVPKKSFPHDKAPIMKNEHLAHCHKMLGEMEIFVQENRMEKVFRWLGFIQGVLWSTGVYSIEELKNHNRP